MDFVYQELTGKQKSIFQFMRQLDFDFSPLSLSDFARLCQASEHTVLALCRKMGFAGYKDLRQACGLDPALRLNLAYKEISDRDESLKPYLAWQHAALASLNGVVEDLDLAFLERQVSKLLEAREIVSFGHNVSAIPSQFLSHRLNLMSRKCVACQLGLGSDLSLHLSRMTSHDLVVLFSFQPYYQPISKIVKFTQEHNVPLITVTDSLESPAAAGPDHTIIVQTAVPIFDNSMLSPIAVVEALSSLLAFKLGPSGQQAIKANGAVNAYLFGDKWSL